MCAPSVNHILTLYSLCLPGAPANLSPRHPFCLTSLSPSDPSLPSLRYHFLLLSPLFTSICFASPPSSHPRCLCSLICPQLLGPALHLQTPAGLLCHDITHPAAPTADAGAAPGAGAPRAAKTAGFPVPADHRIPDPCHQCQRPLQFAGRHPSANGGAQGKKPWWKV